MSAVGVTVGDRDSVPGIHSCLQVQPNNRLRDGKKKTLHPGYKASADSNHQVAFTLPPVGRQQDAARQDRRCSHRSIVAHTQATSPMLQILPWSHVVKKSSRVKSSLEFPFPFFFPSVLSPRLDADRNAKMQPDQPRHGISLSALPVRYTRALEQTINFTLSAPLSPFLSQGKRKRKYAHQKLVPQPFSVGYPRRH